MKGNRATEREVRKLLLNLCRVVESAVAALDAEMKKPSTAERGKRISLICNVLEFEKDRGKHFGLGLPLGRRIP